MVEMMIKYGLKWDVTVLRGCFCGVNICYLKIRSMKNRYYNTIFAGEEPIFLHQGITRCPKARFPLANYY